MIFPGSIAATVINDTEYNAFPGLVQLANGTLVCIYFSATAHDAAESDLLYRISTDLGATWGSAQIFYNPGVGADARDPEVIRLANGNLLVSFFQNSDSNVYVIIATVSGDTITPGSPILACDAFDEFNACSSKPIQLAGSGHILLPIYGKDAADTLEHAAVIKSTDNGATWGAPVSTASAVSTIDYNESNGVQLGSGRVALIVRNETLKGYSETHSDDAGATWSTPTNVINLGADQPGRPALLLLPSGDLMLMTRKGGTVTAGYAVSTDDGANWSSLAAYGATIEQLFVYASLINLSGGGVGAVIAREEDVTGADSFIVYQKFEEFAFFEIAAQRAKVASASGVASQDLAFPNAVVTGNLLVVLGTTFDTSAPTSIGVNDTLGTIYTVITATRSTDTRIFIAFGVAPSSGANIVTVDPEGSAYISYSITEFECTNPPSLDVDGGAATGTTANPTKTITTEADNTLVLGVMDPGANNAMAPGTNFTEIGEEENGLLFEPYNAEFILSGALGNVSTAWVMAEPPSTWVLLTISLKQEAAAQVATPAISPAAGAILTTDDITITCATAGADIYYTIDGSTPDATDTLYTGAFNLAASATVKAIGILAGSTDSAVASSAFTIATVATLSISPFSKPFLSPFSGGF